MNTILTKLKDFVGLNSPPDSEEYDYYEEDLAGDDYQSRYEEQSPQVEEEERQNHRRYREQSTVIAETEMGPSTRTNVIGMPGVTTSIAEVVVIEPHSFEEMPKVIQTLRERKSVVLNLNVMDPEEAQRAVDFIAGATYAIDGHQERIGESIFLFTPSCVKVTTLSGGVQEASETAKSPSRSPVSTPLWAPESSLMAQ